jgi:hypothetical protein
MIILRVGETSTPQPSMYTYVGARRLALTLYINASLIVPCSVLEPIAVKSMNRSPTKTMTLFLLTQ